MSFKTSNIENKDIIKDIATKMVKIINLTNSAMGMNRKLKLQLMDLTEKVSELEAKNRR